MRFYGVSDLSGSSEPWDKNSPCSTLTFFLTSQRQGSGLSRTSWSQQRGSSERQGDSWFTFFHDVIKHIQPQGEILRFLCFYMLLYIYIYGHVYHSRMSSCLLWLYAISKGPSPVHRLRDLLLRLALCRLSWGETQLFSLDCFGHHKQWNTRV